MWLKDKLFNRKIEGESSIDSLLNAVVQNEETNTTELGGNVKIGGSSEVHGDLRIDGALTPSRAINTIVLNDIVSEIHISDGNYVIDYSNRTIDEDVYLEFDSKVIIVYGGDFGAVQIDGLDSGLCNSENGSFAISPTFRGQLSISRIGCIVVISYGLWTV